MSTPQIDFRPSVDIAGVYTTGLSGLATNSQGTTLGDVASEGLLLTFGVSGTHSWKHTKIGLDYTGSITHYATATYGNYDRQSFLLSVIHQFSPHTSFALQENASITSQPIDSTGLPQTVTFDPASADNPTTDFYDNRTTFLTTKASFTFQKSARLSFSLAGQGSLTDRQGGAGLYSVTGGGATGDVQYRITRRSTVGATYSYMHFEYHGTFNATDVHTVSGSYGVQLTRSLEFSGYAGVSNSQAKFLEDVPLDPALAALIGLTNGVAISYSSTYRPTFDARLSLSFQRGVASLSSAYSVTPGNGLFLTSTALRATAGYSYTGLKRWSLGATATYTRADSISNVVGTYGDVSGNLSVARQISHFVHLTFTVRAMQYESASFGGYNRLTYSANLGLAIAPGDIPLRVW